MELETAASCKPEIESKERGWLSESRWVGVCQQHIFGQRFSVASMMSINLGIRFHGVETSDAGQSIEPEESY
jgi:hypothetical protein